MRRTIAVLVIMLVAVLALPAAADEKPEEEKDVLRRLMAEPVTLFDWGLERIDRDIAAAAADALPRRLGPSMGRPVTGAIYDWRANMITVYVSVALPPPARTRDGCRATFGDIVANLTTGAPGGPNAAGWYLLNAFKPKGHFWGSRFEDIGGKLLKMVTLEVSFIPATFEAVRGDSARVRCAGRLNATPEEIKIEVTS